MKNKKKRGKVNKKQLNLGALNKKIIDVFQERSYPISQKILCRHLEIKDRASKQQVFFLIKNLLIDGTIKEVASGKYGLNRNQELFEGIIEKTASGAGYVICDQLDSDIYVSPKILAIQLVETQ